MSESLEEQSAPISTPVRDDSAKLAESAKSVESAESAEKVQLEIRKGDDRQCEIGGLRFEACRREVGEIDGGITLYVWGPGGADALALLRFDFFRARPHYHSPAENQRETAIDAALDSDSLAWGIQVLTTQAPEMIAEAGFPEIAEQLDANALNQGAPALRALLDDLPAATEISYFEIDAKVLAGLSGPMAD